MQLSSIKISNNNGNIKKNKNSQNDIRSIW